MFRLHRKENCERENKSIPASIYLLAAERTSDTTIKFRVHPRRTPVRILAWERVSSATESPFWCAGGWYFIVNRCLSRSKFVRAYLPKSNLRCLKCGSRQRVKLANSLAERISAWNVHSIRSRKFPPIYLESKYHSIIRSWMIVEHSKRCHPRSRITGADVFSERSGHISQLRDMSLISLHGALFGVPHSPRRSITTRAKVAGNSRTNGGVIKVILRPSPSC